MITNHADKVATHYSDAGIGERILAALQAEGVDIDALTPEILAPIDQFHTRGIAATREHIELAAPTGEMHVLDVGCGLGGGSRFAASRFGCRVTGIDLTAEYVETAKPCVHGSAWTTRSICIRVALWTCPSTTAVSMPRT